MSRVLGWIRAGFFPLLAIVGVGLLSAAGEGWLRFYRELYDQEQATLATLAEGGLSCEYRRTGDLSNRWRNASAPEDAGFGSFTAGRIESARALTPRPLPQALRDRLLRLPGMAAYVENYPDDIRLGATPLTTATLLGRPLPELAPAIDEAELARRIPHGEPVVGAEREELIATIAEAWRTAEPLERPCLTIEAFDVQTETRLRDGDRSWRQTVYSASKNGTTEEFAFTRDGVEFQIATYGDERRLVARGPQGFELPWGDLGLDSFRRSPFFAAAVASPWYRTSTIDLGERSVASVERIDDVRYVLAIEPFEFAGLGTAQVHELQIVVRSDMNWATERTVAKIEYSMVPANVRTVFVREFRRLERQDDVVYASARLWDEVTAPEASAAGRAFSTRFAVEFDPPYDAGIFEPKRYGVVPWAEAEPLPIVRDYRVTALAGGVLCFVGAVGWLATHRRSSRSQRPAKSAENQTPARSRTGLRLPAARFGLATVGAAALLAISAAGWVKSQLDVVRDERATLARLQAQSAEFEIERRKPAFPWSFVSSDAWPFDAPITIADLQSWDRDVPSLDVRDALLGMPELHVFNHDDGSLGTIEGGTLGVETLLERELPSVESFHIAEAEVADPLPRGEPVGAAEARRIVAATRSAWREAAASFPTRYLLQARESGGTEAVVADGPRHWRAPDRIEPANYALKTHDGRFDYAYRFGYVEGKPIWRLTHRDDGFFDDEEDELPGAFDPDRRRKPPYASTPFRNSQYDMVVESLRDVLESAPDEAPAVLVDRLGDGRWRIEFEPPRRHFQDGGVELCVPFGWAVVVDENLAWSIVASEIEANASELSTSSAGRDDVRIVCRTINRIEMEGGVPILVECRTRVERREGVEDSLRDAVAAYAYDFDARFDDDFFRSPHVGYAELPPYPIEPSPVGWPHMTALLACGMFGYGLVRRVVDRRAKS